MEVDESIKLKDVKATEEPTPVLIKAVFLGEDCVGKSSILLRFKDEGSFTDKYIPTIGVDFAVKTMKPSKTSYKLQLWDTAGQERFRNITTSYIRGAKGVFLVYDITNKKSFSMLGSWKSNVDSSSGSEDERNKRVLILVGNKVDQSSKREVTTEEGQAYADSLGIPFYETSAKDNINIDELFRELIRQVNKKEGNLLKWWQKE